MCLLSSWFGARRTSAVQVDRSPVIRGTLHPAEPARPRGPGLPGGRAVLPRPAQPVPPDRLPGSSEAAAPLAFRCRSAGAGYSHQQFTERIIRALKERTAPWQSTEERARMKELEREVRELRRAK